MGRLENARAHGRTRAGAKMQELGGVAKITPLGFEPAAFHELFP